MNSFHALRGFREYLIYSQISRLRDLLEVTPITTNCGKCQKSSYNFLRIIFWARVELLMYALNTFENDFPIRVLHLFKKPLGGKPFFFTLFEKSNFCPKIQFWHNHNIFTSFPPKLFWQFFSWNQSCQQLRSPKPQHFHEFFILKNRQFLRKIKVEFLDKKWRFRTVWKYSEKIANLNWIFLWILSK